MNSTVVFEKFSIHSFGGINKANPIIFVFPPPKGIAKQIGIMSGDKGTNKTSVVRSILYAFASVFKFKQENLINLDDDQMSGEFDFRVGVKRFRIKFTKSKFQLLKEYHDGENSRYLPEGSAKETIEELLGPVATSPMELQEKKDKDQIKWLWNMLNVPAETMSKHDSLEANLQAATKAASTATEEYKKLKSDLADNLLYKNWAVNEEKFKVKKTVDTAKRNLEEAEKASRVLAEKKADITMHQNRINDLDGHIGKAQAEILRLQESVKEYESRKQEQETKLAECEQFIKDNEAIEIAYQTAYADFLNISTEIVEQQKWLEVVRKRNEMDQFETAKQNAESLKDQIRQEIRGLVKKILPDIPGLEVVTEKSIDGPAIGIYVEGKTPAQLCESELYDLWLKLCDIKGTSMVVIENWSVLGTEAVQTINYLAQQGVQVWVTQMHRGQREASIEFVDELQ